MNVIEIVGGGMAGLALGIALRSRGVPVSIKEAGTYPRHRLCGEFLNGVKEETLRTLCIDGIFAKAGCESQTRWWIGGRWAMEHALERPALTRSRWRLDAEMAEEFVRLGGDLQTGVRVPREAGEGRVWAAGRVLERESQWLGLKAHYELLDDLVGLEMHLGQGGYIGLARVEDGRVNVCGLFRKRPEVKGKGSELLLAYLTACGLHELVERLQYGRADERSVTGVSGVAFGCQRRNDGLLSIGDAERVIPPFTGNGMSMALEAAECALKPLVAYASGSCAWEQTRTVLEARLEERFRLRIRLAGLFHGMICSEQGQNMLEKLARLGWIPFVLMNRMLT